VSMLERAFDDLKAAGSAPSAGGDALHAILGAYGGRFLSMRRTGGSTSAIERTTCDAWWMPRRDYQNSSRNAVIRRVH
jgi:hypothetical protein